MFFILSLLDFDLLLDTCFPFSTDLLKYESSDFESSSSLLDHLLYFLLCPWLLCELRVRFCWFFNTCSKFWTIFNSVSLFSIIHYEIYFTQYISYRHWCVVLHFIFIIFWILIFIENSIIFIIYLWWVLTIELSFINAIRI